MNIYVRDQETFDFLKGQLDFILHVLYFGRNADWVIEWDPEEWDSQTLETLEKRRSKAEEMYDQCVKFVRSINQNSNFDRNNMKEVYRYINRLNNIIDFLDNRIKEENDKRKKEKETDKEEEYVIIEDDEE